MSRIDQPLIQAIQHRLIGEDPLSVRAQVLTAAGVVLASYLFFFVLTQGRAGTEAGTGNIIADSGDTRHPTEVILDVPPPSARPRAPESALEAIGQIALGLGEGRRRAQLVQLTEPEHKAFFEALEIISEHIIDRIQSRSGRKAVFEVRYRVFEAAVAAILQNDSSVFISDRGLASKWQNVKDASKEVYRISYQPVAGSSPLHGERDNWHSELTRGVTPMGLVPRGYLAAIAEAKERLFDEGLTVGVYEDVLSGEAFVRDTMSAVDNAHEAMDAFYEALKPVAGTNKTVSNAIKRKRVDLTDRPFGLDLMESFHEEYDLREILSYAYGFGQLLNETSPSRFSGWPIVDEGFADLLAYPAQFFPVHAVKKDEQHDDVGRPGWWPPKRPVSGRPGGSEKPGEDGGRRRGGRRGQDRP